MGTKRIIFSPCLLYENEDFFDWMNLRETLSFISEYLDCVLDTYEGSFFHKDSWYSNPRCDVNMMTYFSKNIFPLLCELSGKGTSYSFDNFISLSEIEIDKSFKITNKTEFKLLISYIYEINRDCIVFVGTPNYEFKNSYLDLHMKDIIIQVPIIKNPWVDETGHFDFFISEEIKNYDEPFPCKAICKEIGSIRIDKGNRALYEKYGDIIAKRNGYSKLPYTKNQYKAVPYYKRHDNEYIICLDMLHGTFEVFKKQQGTRYENYKGEYDFCGNYIKAKKSDANTHKCYKYY